MSAKESRRHDHLCLLGLAQARRAREAYEDLCQRVSVPLMSAQPGSLTWRMGAERPDRPDDFVFISLWRDLKSLKAFTGEEWEAASIVP
jgi:hypothetical protein